MTNKISYHEAEDELAWYETDKNKTGEGIIFWLKPDKVEIGNNNKYQNLKVSSKTTSTSGTASVEHVRIDSLWTGAGAVGAGMRVNLETNVALGGYVNAIYASVDCKTSGRATGLLSSVCSEITMPGSAGGAGTYAIYEAEVVCPASWTGTNNVSVMYIGTSGNTKANFDTYGYLFDISGVASKAEGFWYSTANGTTDGWLKIRVNNVVYYLMASLVQTEA